MKTIFKGTCFIVLFLGIARGFCVEPIKTRTSTWPLSSQSNSDDNFESFEFSRRKACKVAIGGAIIGSGVIRVDRVNAEEGYIPAQRPTAYRVDSTQPPTLIPIANARKETSVLSKLGKGFGTEKEMIVDDRVNLNNILNKAVFGTIDTVSGITGAKKQERKSGPGFSSFVCLGVPTAPTSSDIDLATSILDPIKKERTTDTAIGLSICPLSSQSDLDTYSKSGDEAVLVDSMKKKGVSSENVELYLPLIRYARKNSLHLLALAPEQEDILTARKIGLQNVDLERRQSYVVDAEGFIAMSADPKFRVYTERSLLKDFVPISNDDKPGDFFAERILVHETAATVAARYAVQRPDSLVVVVAPTADLRFLLGINGRISRLCQFLDPTKNQVTDDSITTILLNPTAKDTLSKTRYLRLEVGTGPDTLDYQTKVSDYLWFSSSPKVNLIPRLMNG